VSKLTKCSPVEALFTSKQIQEYLPDIIQLKSNTVNLLRCKDDEKTIYKSTARFKKSKGKQEFTNVDRMNIEQALDAVTGWNWHGNYPVNEIYFFTYDKNGKPVKNIEPEDWANTDGCRRGMLKVHGECIPLVKAQEGSEDKHPIIRLTLEDRKKQIKLSVALIKALRKKGIKAVGKAMNDEMNRIRIQLYGSKYWIYLGYDGENPEYVVGQGSCLRGEDCIQMFYYDDNKKLLLKEIADIIKLDKGIVDEHHVGMITTTSVQYAKSYIKNASIATLEASMKKAKAKTLKKNIQSALNRKAGCAGSDYYDVKKGSCVSKK
jgi:hypothetical protein